VILLNDLGDGYPTFPQFQQMLRDYEHSLLDDLQIARTFPVPPPQPPVVKRVRPRLAAMTVDVWSALDIWPKGSVPSNIVREPTAPAVPIPQPRFIGEYHAEQVCMECGHVFTLKPDATDTFCDTCGPRWRRHRAI